MPAHDDKDGEARSPTRRRRAADADDMDDAPRAGSLGGQATSFLALIRPYRELLALVVGVVTVGLAVYGWTVSYFATRSQLSNLNCTIDSRIDYNAASVTQKVLSAEAKAKRERLDELIADTVPSDQQGHNKIISLSKEAESEEDQAQAATNDLSAQGMKVTCS